MYIGESAQHLTGEEAFETLEAMRGMDMQDEAQLIATAIDRVIQEHRPGITITNPADERYDREAKVEFLHIATRRHVVTLPLNLDLVGICSELLRQESAFMQMRHRPRPKAPAPPPRPPAGYRPGSHHRSQRRPVG